LVAVRILKARKRRSSPVDRRLEHSANGPVHATDFLRRECVRAALRMDTGLKERLVGVDIPETTYKRLVEDYGLDLAGATSQAFFEPRRREAALEWFAAKPLFKLDQIIAMEMDDATEFALIGEAEIETVVELDRQPLETQGWRIVRYGAQPPGHPQVDDDRGPIVQIKNEVFGASSDTENSVSFDAGENVFDTVVA
jgi:hypothetical protein